MPIRNFCLWAAFLPLAFAASCAVTVGLEYVIGVVRRAGGESAGKCIEWIVFAIRAGIFIIIGTFIAPSTALPVASVLAVIHTLASVSPADNPKCTFATILGSSGTLFYFIAT